MCLTPEFDELAYLILNPDVAAAVRAGSLPSGHQHWVEHGQREGRLCRMPVSRPDFDEAGYLQLNPDVAEAVRAGVFCSGRDHWLARGLYEGRQGAALPGAGEQRRDLRPLRRKPFGVNYYGAHSAASGLGEACRGYVEALGRLRIGMYAVDVPPWSGQFPRASEEVATSPVYRLNLIHQNADMVPFFVRKYGKNLFRSAYNIGLWVWELGGALPEWHPASTHFDEIWVPSSFCQGVLASVSAVPVVRMPYAILPVKGSRGRAHFGIPADAFVFLYIFDVASQQERKNPEALVRAFQGAFPGRSGAVLVLKYQNAHHNPQAVERLMRLAGPSTITFSGTMSPDEIASLHGAADCFVSPHRAEGFGLNIAQAMWIAKPVIATGYSGNMDFTRSNNSFLIEYGLVRIPNSVGPYTAGMVWAEPSIPHLAHLLRLVFENRESASRKGAEAARLIQREYSVDSVASNLETRFADIGLDGGALRCVAGIAVGAVRAAFRVLKRGSRG